MQKNFLRCLGQHIEGSGLDSILIDVNVYGSNTMGSILKGNQYNIGIRVHKLIYEALRSIQLNEFIGSIKYSDDEMDTFDDVLQQIREAIVDKDEEGVRTK